MNIKKFTIYLVIVSLILTAALVRDSRAARIKDLVGFEGVRSNHLIGYGLIVGLKGTGDTTSTQFMMKSLGEALARLGISGDSQSFKVKNVAAVMVTAELPAFARQGSHLDVVISSIGDAKSLQGGTLLMTPLKAANQEVYAVAQGPISIGGFSVESNETAIQQNHPTVGRISSGALVEKEVDLQLADMKELNISLNEPDFTTALRITNKINDVLNGNYADAIDSGSVNVKIPNQFTSRIVQLISRIETLEVKPDAMAKVILNERTGTIVMGSEVKIAPVAVAHGNLTIQVTTEYEVSQPNPFATGDTRVVPKTSILADTGEEGSLALVEGVSIGELVRALNELGVTPRDLIAIIQAIKSAGALQAVIEIT
ncbi:MAG: flagellar basal body P-ring protein FlgI [Deltaproteobacteria bacterium]|nr:flagellar basal body P-ring protein FlgI [Deltaproteobacteria bacterium]